MEKIIRHGLYAFLLLACTTTIVAVSATYNLLSVKLRTNIWLATIVIVLIIAIRLLRYKPVKQKSKE